MKYFFLPFCFIIEFTATEVYNVQSNFDVNSQSVDSDLLVASYKTKIASLCLAQCNQKSDCFSSVVKLDAGQSDDNCFLYRKYFVPNDLITKQQTKLYAKKCAPVATLDDKRCIPKNLGFLYAFSYYKLQFQISTFLNTVVSAPHGIEEIFDGYQYNYYVMAYSGNALLKFNEKWEFVSNISLTKIAFAKAINKELFIGADSFIIKTNSNLTVLRTYSKSLMYYRGISYHSASDLIYIVTGTSYSSIELFDRNLTYVGFFNITGGDPPYSIAEYTGNMYCGTLGGKILVIQNREIIQTFTTLCADRISSIQFDTYGYMVISCYNRGLYLYHTNGTYAGKQFPNSTILSTGKGFILDSMGRLIVNNANFIQIYF